MSDVEVLRAEVASLVELNSYLEERQVDLENTNGDLRAKVAELETLLGAASETIQSLEAEIASMHPESPMKSDPRVDVSSPPTPLRPPQRPASPSPMGRDDEPDEVHEDDQERPSTSRGVPQPSPERFTDYVAESPIGTGTSISGVVTFDEEGDQGGVVFIEGATAGEEDEDYQDQVEAEEYDEDDEVYDDVMEEFETIPIDTDVVFSREMATFEERPMPAWPDGGDHARPKTSRRVPSPSPSQYTDYMPRTRPDDEGTPTSGTVTMAELRDGDEGGPGSPFLRKRTESRDFRPSPIVKGGGTVKALPISLERDLQRLIAALERPNTAPAVAR